MPPKRPSPLDEPPTASSEEEESSSEEEEEEEEEESKGGSSEEEGDAKDETPKKTPAPAVKKPEPQSSTSESGSESDSETDDESGNIVKPVASKPDPKGKMPNSNVSATAGSVKRPSENDGGKESKRAKKKGVAVEGGAVAAAGEKSKSVDESKKLFQRLWSEDDEITILKGMIDYSAKKGSDPTLDMNVFYDFIRNSIDANVSRAQLMDKIRRLKKKYKNNVGRGKKGEDPKFSKPHEQKAFELSKKVWGAEGISKAVETPKSNGTARKKHKPSTPFKKESFQPEHAPEDNYKMQLDGNEGTSDQGNEFLCSFEKYFSSMGYPKSFLYKGLELVGPAKRAELEEEWKKLEMAELELFVRKIELVRDQAKLILEAYKSSCK